jgi:hypothetical protein
MFRHMFRHMSRSSFDIRCCCLRRGQHWRQYLPEMYTIAAALLVPPSPLNISSPGKGIQQCNQRGRSSRARSNHVINTPVIGFLTSSPSPPHHHLISSLHHQSLNQTSIIESETNSSSNQLLFNQSHLRNQNHPQPKHFLLKNHVQLQHHPAPPSLRPRARRSFPIHLRRHH